MSTNGKPLIKIKNGKKYYLKLTGNQRAQHFVLLVTFITCVLTGMPLKYYYYPWAETLLGFFGGVSGAAIVHRISGVIMVCLFIYHIFYIYKQLNRYYIRPAKTVGEFSFKGLLKYIYLSPVFPRYKDLIDMKDMMKYYLFLSNKPPRHERFYWREKLDYLAVFWGINVLGITGAILWYKGFFMEYLPGWAVSVATIAHSFEALLATADILIWHMYNAHVNYDKFPASDLFLTGYLPENIMRHEYVLEWKRINRIAEEDPSVIFNKDEWDLRQKEREAEQYKDTMDYMAAAAAASKGETL